MHQLVLSLTKINLRWAFALKLASVAISLTLLPSPVRATASLSRCESLFSRRSFAPKFAVDPKAGRIVVDGARLREIPLETDPTSWSGRTRKYAANVLEALPQAELSYLHQLKELSIVTGGHLGLKAKETEGLLADWFERGIIGGEAHIRMLAWDETTSQSIRYSNPTGGRGYARNMSQAVFTKDAFATIAKKYLSESARRKKIDEMVERAFWISRIREPTDQTTDERAKAVLAVWYAGTFDQIIESATKTAPTALEIRARSLPFYLSRGVWAGAALSVFASGVGHYAGLEAITALTDTTALGFVGARASLSALRRTRLGQWVIRATSSVKVNADKRIREKIRAAGAVSGPHMTRLQPVPLPPFNVNEPAPFISQALLAEMTRIEFRNELFKDLDVSVVGTNTALTAATVEPLVNLAAKTAELQIQRLQQMRAAVGSVNFEQLPMNYDRYSNQLQQMQIDLGVTQNALRSLATTIQNSRELREVDVDRETTQALDQLAREVESESLSFEKQVSLVSGEIRAYLTPHAAPLEPIH